jgi:hypothetical protein
MGAHLQDQIMKTNQVSITQTTRRFLDTHWRDRVRRSIHGCRRGLWLAATFALSLGFAPAIHAQVKVSDLGTVGVYDNGEPGLTSTGARRTEWYFPDAPLMVVNVPCPNTSLEIEETKKSSVTWSMNMGATIGAEWSVVTAELSASFGVTIGQEHEIKIKKTINGDKYVSREARIYTRYTRKRFQIAIDGLAQAFIDVYIPAGWYEMNPIVPPTCQCPKVEDSKQGMNRYGDTITPGTPLHHAVLTSVANLDGVLQLFNTPEVTQLYPQLMTGLAQSLQSIDVAFRLGADPWLCERVGYDLTRGTMDNIVGDVLKDATSDHIFDDLTQLPANPHCARAHQSLDKARAMAEAEGSGPGRFRAVAGLYAQAFDAAMDASRFTYSDATCARSRDLTSADEHRPGPGDPNGTIPGPQPGLSIGTAVILSWPASAADYVLDDATSVNGPWKTVSQLPKVEAGQRTVVLKVGERASFYRLRKLE